MPADSLDRARQVQDAAARLGFDWPEIDGAWDKLHEEIGELQAAASDAERREELGDLLFMLVNLSRHLGVNPQAALAQATAKFERRFAHVQAGMRAQGRPMEAAELDAMEALWQAAKRLERRGEPGYRSASGQAQGTGPQGDDQ